MKIVAAAIASLFAVSTANAVEYTNVKVTGVGLDSTTEYIRFTIDADPNAIITTQGFAPEQHKRLVALIIAAYTAQSPVYWIRTTEASASPSVRRYVQLNFLSLGTQTWD